MESAKAHANRLIDFLRKTSTPPDQINPILLSNDTAAVNQSTKLAKILSRPQLTMDDLKPLPTVAKFLEENKPHQETLEQAEIQIKYAGYIEKEEAQAKKLDRLESIQIPDGFDYKNIQSISTEARQKLLEIQPKTLSQASRISGVSPSDISVLLVHMGR